MDIRRRNGKLLFYSIVCIFFYVLIYQNRLYANMRLLLTPESIEKHRDIVYKYYDIRKDWVTSNLGSHLFKYTSGRKPGSYADIRTKGRGVFNVLIWKHWLWLRMRHVDNFGLNKYDPLSNCSVDNCRFSGDDSPEDVYMADAVVVHLQKGYLPDFERRDANQLWIFWSDESPRHTFHTPNRVPPPLALLANLFNWSMTYRSDSDIPIPYGRTIPLPYPKLNEITNDGLKQLVPFWNKKRRDVLAANVMTRCVLFRKRLLKQLQRYISVDTYGKCATRENDTLRCPGYFTRDCPVISEYLFYVAIENSNCRQYITEKVFHHGYAKGAIPIIMGAPLEDCTKLLPPNSFIHADRYDSMKDLAKEVYSISNNLTRYLSYHAWRNNFDVMEEHGFLGTRSFALCRLCEALNYNHMSRKEYKVADIRLYLDPTVCCAKTAHG